MIYVCYVVISDYISDLGVLSTWRGESAGITNSQTGTSAIYKSWRGESAGITNSQTGASAIWTTGLLVSQISKRRLAGSMWNQSHSMRFPKPNQSMPSQTPVIQCHPCPPKNPNKINVQMFPFQSPMKSMPKSEANVCVSVCLSVCVCESKVKPVYSHQITKEDKILQFSIEREIKFILPVVSDHLSCASAQACGCNWQVSIYFILKYFLVYITIHKSR